MPELHQVLAEKVGEWRREGYPCESYPTVAEVLEWSRDPESGALRYLRRPQLEALETYWYLRLVLGTPHIFDLYSTLFSSTRDRLEALGLSQQSLLDFVIDNSYEALIERVRSDDQFVIDLRLQALRETLTLDYPSYILALAMGAGKTVLIGAIVATEFAMALEYPDGPFVHNALVFAPGKTIIESLRELAEVPYAQILPPRLHRPFSASMKLLFTRDGEKDIPVIRGSSFNLVVTNTEKIRIQKEAVRKSDVGLLPFTKDEDEAKAEVANLRLQAIASLPHLAVFSDEAHHTYGQSMEKGLKKVRKTVDYLAEQTNVLAVVNTTGTPYYKRQPLKDVVFWYGLSQGIKDNYLKDLAGNIKSYRFDGDAATYVDHVVRDFFERYGDVRLPNGAQAKIAIYFPQTSDLKELRPIVDRALLDMGLGPEICLVNTSDSSLTGEQDIQAFNRLNDPASPHRIMLLVNKGTEGWNCHSLFACALARKLRTSNNFVLQAATRCLRQVPGNDVKASVYLSIDNFAILDKQLQETYGERLSDLNFVAQETCRTRIVLRKLSIPPLVVKQIVRTVVRKDVRTAPLKLSFPEGADGPRMVERTFTVSEEQASYGVLRQVGDSVTIDAVADATDVYGAAVELSARYRLNVWVVYDELRRLYKRADVPLSHMNHLASQIEEQISAYEVHEEVVERALALVHPEAFDQSEQEDGTTVYTAEIAYPRDREHLLMHLKDRQGGCSQFGFHYSPYNFDSMPEKSFFIAVLDQLGLAAGDVEDIYFTGAITDPAKTDFHVSYRDDKGKWRRYTPDFVIRKNPAPGGARGSGRTYIVEIKRDHDRAHPIDGEGGKKEMAVRKWTELDPERLRYEIIFAKSDSVAADDTKNVRHFVEERET